MSNQAKSKSSEEGFSARRGEEVRTSAFELNEDTKAPEDSVRNENVTFLRISSQTTMTVNTDVTTTGDSFPSGSIAAYENIMQQGQIKSLNQNAADSEAHLNSQHASGINLAVETSNITNNFQFEGSRPKPTDILDLRQHQSVENIGLGLQTSVTNPQTDGRTLTFSQEVSNIGLSANGQNDSQQHSLTVSTLGDIQDGGPYYVVVSASAVMPTLSGSSETLVISKQNTSALVEPEQKFQTTKQAKRKHMDVSSLHLGEKASDQYLRHAEKQVKLDNDNPHQTVHHDVLGQSSALIDPTQQIANQLTSGTEISQIYAVTLATDSAETGETVPQLQLDSSGGIGSTQLVTLCPISSERSGITIPTPPAPSVNQHWFTSKDDKSSLHVKGMKWKQGMWSKEEEAMLKSNIEEYCRMQGIEDPIRLIFGTPKDERKDFYRSIAAGISRPLFAIYRKVLRLYDDKNNIGKYTDDEVKKLQDLKKKHGNDWAAIGNELGRSAASVKDRCRLLRENKKTGKWTPEEEKLLSDTVREQTQTKSGQCITTGINWGQIAEKLGNRTEKQCRSKWLNYLNWKEAGGKQWTKVDEIEIIKRVAEVEATDESELDWNYLSDDFPSARSPQWLRAKWWSLKKRVPKHCATSFQECINYLQTAYLDNLRVKIDRQSISNYGPSSSPRRDQSGSIGSESSALGFGSLTSTSTTNDLSGPFTSQSDNNSAFATSTSYDLSSVQGFPVHLQLTTQPILLPVTSNGLPSNFSDHFVIQPVNMTSVLSGDELSYQGGYVLQSVDDRNDSQGSGEGAKSVELTQTMVQTDLSIPIPSGEISQEDLTAANIEALSGEIAPGLGETALDEASMSLATSQQNEINPTEITVTTADCSNDDDIQVVSFSSDVAVTVTKVEPADAINLDSPTEPPDL